MQKMFLWHIFMQLSPHPLTPSHLHHESQLKQKNSQSYTTQLSFLRTSIVVLILETVNSATGNDIGPILGVFLRSTTQNSNLFLTFTSDAMKGNASHMLWFVMYSKNS